MLEKSLNKRSYRFQQTLLATAVASIVSFSAVAEDVALEEVEVVGIRGSLSASADMKR